jgi:hypothetical protein
MKETMNLKRRSLLLLASLAVFAAPLQAQNTGAKWTQPVSGESTRNLTYTAVAQVLGKPTKIEVNFFVDPSNHKESAGALGVDVAFHDSDKFSGFKFDAFDGPDAPAQAKKLMSLSVDGKPGFQTNEQASGGYGEGKIFSFSVSELTRRPKSPAKSFLQAIAAGGDNVSIVITDFKNPKLKLEITVPVADQRNAFKKLLLDVK